MSSRRHRLAVASAALAAMLLISVGVTRMSSAAFTAHSDTGAGWESGRVSVTDDDAGQALFDTATNGLLDGGSTQTNCIAVTYNGTFTKDVAIRLHATTSGTLAPYLDLKVEEGTGGGAGTCAGFSATTTVHEGTLEGFGAAHPDAANGASAWVVTGTPETRTYRFTVTVQNIPAAQNKAAAATLAWTAGTIPEFTPSALASNSVWLRAADLPSQNQPVTWTNRAPGGPNAVEANPGPVRVDGATPNAGPAVRFTGTGNYTILNPFSVATATATSELSSDYLAQFAIDNDRSQTNGTTWASSTLPATWSMQWTDTARTLTGYSITVSFNASQAPTDWDFQGSNDGSAWTTLDSQTGITGWTPGVPRHITFANTTAYKHYRFDIAAGNGAGFVNIAEFDFDDHPTNATSAEAWAVLRADAPSTFAGLWQMGSERGAGAYSSYYPYNDGTIYEGFGMTTQPVLFTPTQPITNWHIYRVQITPSNWEATINGVVQASTAGGAAYWPSQAILGSNRTGWGFRGDIAEVLIRTRASDPGEISKITAYLKKQHGLP